MSKIAGPLHNYRSLLRAVNSTDEDAVPYLPLPSLSHLKWLVPLQLRAAAWRSLDLYAPGKVLGKALRLILRFYVFMISRNSSRVIWLSSELLQRTVPALSESGVSGPIAISLGAQTAREKLTCMLFNQHGLVVAYAKVACMPLGKAALQIEAGMLHRLSGTRVAGNVPKLINLIEGPDNIVLVQTPGPRELSFNKLSSAHWVFLSGLVEDQSFLMPAELNVRRNWEKRLDRAEKTSDPEIVLALRTALQLMNSASPFPIRSCLVHGDFVPWNIRNQQDSIFVFDWEQGFVDGFPFFDICHFIVQQGIVSYNASTEEIVKSLDAVKADDNAINYCKHAGVPTSQIGMMILSYFFEIILDRLEVGESASNSDQRARLKILQSLLGASPVFSDAFS